MVKDAIAALQLKAKHEPIGFNLLPDHFTIPQLQSLYESIYQTKRDSRNFRKKVLSLGLIENTNLKDKTGSKKGAFLYTFKKSTLSQGQLHHFSFDF